jgi:hypothetical protein
MSKESCDPVLPEPVKIISKRAAERGGQARFAVIFQAIHSANVSSKRRKSKKLELVS